MSKTTARIEGSVAGAGRVKPRKASKPRSAESSRTALDLDRILPEGKLYYRIGEVSQITGVKAYVLRYWESEFRWMSPQKSRSKQRLYRRKDIEMILLIRRLLYEERYTIAGARQRLREVGASKAAAKAKPNGSARTPVPVAEMPSDQDISAQPSYRDRFKQIKEELLAIRATL